MHLELNPISILSTCIHLFSGCPRVFWNVQSTRVSGQDLSISNIGGWDLADHHRYNYQEGILYRGDGTNVYLRETPALIFTSFGDGRRRDYACAAATASSSSACNGPRQQRLLAAWEIAAAPDGSLYVGDYNLVRRISPDGTVHTVLQLNATTVAHRYHLAVNPKSGALYLSDPVGYRIIEVVDTDSPGDTVNNWRLLVGGQGQCMPGDEELCGDGGSGLAARLIYPKGLAVSAKGAVYFADGTTIRMVDERGIISTLVSKHEQQREIQPIPCEGSSDLKEITLKWPVDMAVNPLDDSVYFVDDSMILKLTGNRHLQVVAGRPLHCTRARSSYYNNFASYSTLTSPQAIAFSPTGELYIAESDSQRINRVSVVGTDGRIGVFAGRDSKCNCQDAGCDCFNANNHLAVHSLFSFISGLAVTPDGGIHVIDQTNYRIRTIRKRIPEIDSRQMYEVHSPEHLETYIFNKFGLHIETLNIATKRKKFTFGYSVSTSTGALVSVSDAFGGKISLVRNYAGQVESIENPQRQKFDISVDRKQLLRSFSLGRNSTIEIDYFRSSELLRSRTETNGNGYVYEYDRNGRVVKLVTPTGEVVSLVSDISIHGAIVNITTGRREQEMSLLIQKNFLRKSCGHELEILQQKLDKSFIRETKWGHKVVMKTAPYILLQGGGRPPGLAESFPVTSSESTHIGKEVVNQIEWMYYGDGGGGRNKAVGKKLYVNKEPIFNIELSQKTNNQVLSLDSQRTMVSVNRSRGSEMISSIPGGIFPTIVEEYNSVGLPTRWAMGSLVESYVYDRMNRLKEVKSGNSPGSLLYIYNDAPLQSVVDTPSKVVIPTGGGFRLNHDNTGALESIVTPRGHTHSFRHQLHLGWHALKYYAPWAREPYVQHFDQSGRLLAKVFPANMGKIIYAYDNAGHLRTIIGGLASIHYHYLPGSALVKSVDITDDNFRMRVHQRYHRGTVKQISREFFANVGLNNYTLEYQYDATGHLVGSKLDIIGQTELTSRVKYDIKSGRLAEISHLRISHRSFGMVILQDLAKNYVREKKFDEYARPQSINLIIKGLPLFRANIEYNANGQISLRSVYLQHQTTNEEVAYNANNQVNIVRSSTGTAWIYTHDANGNVVSVTEAGQRVTLGYDAGDRLSQFGDLEFVTYDRRGFVIRRGEQRYAYNALGQMTRAFEPTKFAVRFYYDDRRRLTGTTDHRGNSVQYVYANPYAPHQVTAVHYPKEGRTSQLVYDEDGLLVALETQDNRYYVGTDLGGSPLAVFDTLGSLVKQVKRTPFGRSMHDSNPSLRLHVDFNGGLIEEHTRWVFFKLYIHRYLMYVQRVP